MPGLAYHFGLRPADVDEMSVAEVDVFVKALNAIVRDQRKGAARG